MTRDAIARIIGANIEHLPRINLHRSQIEDAYAKADAILAVGGGVEEAAVQAAAEVYAKRTGTGVGFSDMRAALEAALSPRSADGQEWLAAKDGAAAPPQAPVAGSEDSASEVVNAEVLARELEAFAKAEGAFYDNQNYETLTALERARVSCRERLSAYKAARP